ncbi:hypothetical protein OBBRIDRAFT_260278 [Obba rivulosa]|uniref:Uncharacterized protein n=1 Tax=Obba rivulosa TaxID=1052685 RepID=A0A8E2AK80_9APHY|nr:hypothetical protein OBBRIDRAFT_260278 [Obba rivulosa]
MSPTLGTKRCRTPQPLQDPNCPPMRLVKRARLSREMETPTMTLSDGANAPSTMRIHCHSLGIERKDARRQPKAWWCSQRVDHGCTTPEPPFQKEDSPVGPSTSRNVDAQLQRVSGSRLIADAKATSLHEADATTSEQDVYILPLMFPPRLFIRPSSASQHPLALMNSPYISDHWQSPSLYNIGPLKDQEALKGYPDHVQGASMYSTDDSDWHEMCGGPHVRYDTGSPFRSNAPGASEYDSFAQSGVLSPPERCATASSQSSSYYSSYTPTLENSAYAEPSSTSPATIGYSDSYSGLLGPSTTFGQSGVVLPSQFHDMMVVDGTLHAGATLDGTVVSGHGHKPQLDRYFPNPQLSGSILDPSYHPLHFTAQYESSLQKHTSIDPASFHARSQQQLFIPSTASSSTAPSISYSSLEDALTFFHPPSSELPPVPSRSPQLGLEIQQPKPQRLEPTIATLFTDLDATLVDESGNVPLVPHVQGVEAPPPLQELQFEFYQPEGDGYCSCSDEEDGSDDMNARARRSPGVTKLAEDADTAETERFLLDSPSLSGPSANVGCGPQPLRSDSLLLQPVSDSVTRRFSEPSAPMPTSVPLGDWQFEFDMTSAQAPSWPTFAPDQEGMFGYNTDWTQAPQYDGSFPF